MTEIPNLVIPENIKPKDLRFGSGPSKIRATQLAALVAANPGYLGTSHRQKTVREVVKSLREGLHDLFKLPADYEVVIGNGGATAFWDAAIFGLIKENAQFLSFGEFSNKFASAAKQAPFLKNIDIIKAEPGDAPDYVPQSLFDTYATAHNETSTGVMKEVKRPQAEGLHLVDATSAAGGALVDPKEFDVYYFAPQKSFGSDGGLFVALMSPAALERIVEIKKTNRWQPPFLDLSIALENSRLQQTYNTPSLATIHMFENQVAWFRENGGLTWATNRSKTSSDYLYDWAQSRDFAKPFVDKKELRSSVVAVINFIDSIDALQISAVLRANGIVDTDSYRKIGKNQIRVGVFPSVELSDVQALTNCLDWIVERL
jgi:phosphoserine aminotransferase